MTGNNRTGHRNGAPRAATNRKSLPAIAEERDMTVLSLLNTAFEEHGSVIAAAKALGVMPSAVYGWIHSRGMKLVKTPRIVKPNT